MAAVAMSTFLATIDGSIVNVALPTLVRDLGTMRRFQPYVSPRRNDSAFYLTQDIEVEAALEFLDKRNIERPPDRPMTLFHLFLRSLSQAHELRPRVNRFVKGGKLWQRDGVWLSFPASDTLTFILVMVLFIPIIRSFRKAAAEQQGNIHPDIPSAAGPMESSRVIE